MGPSPLPSPPPPRQRQELESENKKLKHNLAEMRQSLLRDGSASSAAPGSPAYKVLLEQLNASCEELDVRKEEVLILRSQLVSQKEAMHHKVEQHVAVSLRAAWPCTLVSRVVAWCRCSLRLDTRGDRSPLACVHLHTSVVLSLLSLFFCFFSPFMSVCWHGVPKS